jgi:hypothetical protein
LNSPAGHATWNTGDVKEKSGSSKVEHQAATLDALTAYRMSLLQISKYNEDPEFAKKDSKHSDKVPAVPACIVM